MAHLSDVISLCPIHGSDFRVECPNLRGYFVVQPCTKHVKKGDKNTSNKQQSPNDSLMQEQALVFMPEFCLKVHP